MHVSRAGITVLKGARHAALPAIRLERSGPVGDRIFCLVDLEEERVLRTVEHPRLIHAGPVSLASTGEVAELGEEDPARFRATFTLEADRVPAPGAEVAIDEAVIRVRSTLPRCRVIDIDPATGGRRTTWRRWPLARGRWGRSPSAWMPTCSCPARCAPATR